MRRMLAPFFLGVWVVTTGLEFQNSLQVSVDFTRFAPLLPYLKILSYLAAVASLVMPGASIKFWLSAVVCNPLTPLLGWFLAPAFIYVTAHDHAKENPEFLWPDDIDVDIPQERNALHLDLKIAGGFILLSWLSDLLGLKLPLIGGQHRFLLDGCIQVFSLRAMTRAHRIAYVQKFDPNLQFGYEAMTPLFALLHVSSLGALVPLGLFLSLDTQGRPKLQLKDRLWELMQDKDAESLAQFCEEHSVGIREAFPRWLAAEREDSLDRWLDLVVHFEKQRVDGSLRDALEAQRQKFKDEFERGLHSQEARLGLVTTCKASAKGGGFDLGKALDELDLSDRAGAGSLVDSWIDELETKGSATEQAELVVLYGLHSGLACTQR